MLNSEKVPESAGQQTSPKGYETREGVKKKLVTKSENTRIIHNLSYESDYLYTLS